MEIVLTTFGILFALGAAISASVGSGIAAPLVPGYAEKLRNLFFVLKTYIRAQCNLADNFLENLEQTGALNSKDLDVGLYVSVKEVVDVSHKSHDLMKVTEFLNFYKEAERSGPRSLNNHWRFLSGNLPIITLPF